MSLSHEQLEALASELANKHISPSIRGCLFREENKALAADILAALRRAAGGQWVSVEERLPESDGEYWITGHCGRDVKPAEYCHREFYNIDTNESWKVLRPTHWAEINAPQPPTEPK